MLRFPLASLTLLTLLALALASCGAPAARPPSAAPPLTTTAPAPTAAAPAPDRPAITGSVTLWHAYGAGSGEEAAINQLIAQARAAYPDATIEARSIPFDQIFNQFQSEASAGAGPDLFIAPNDALAPLARAGLLADLSAHRAELEHIAPVAISGMTVDGKLYAIPESVEAVALYYHTDRVAAPPATTAELLALVRGAHTIVLNQTPYHTFGWLQAFGGRLLDAEGRCVADQAGGAAWYRFLAELKGLPNVIFSPDAGYSDQLFVEGQAEMIVGGPAALGGYRAALGERLGVAPLPGADQPAGPLTAVDGFYVRAGSPNRAGAVALALFLTSPAALQTYVDRAGHVPANMETPIGDPLIRAFAAASLNGVPQPERAYLDSYWPAFGAALSATLNEGADPAQAVAAACRTMNAATGR